MSTTKRGNDILKEALEDDIREELGHAQMFASRIKELYGFIDVLHDEQGHRRLFEGFLREYEAEGLA